jgi:hypothetical protein
MAAGAVPKKSSSSSSSYIDMGQQGSLESSLFGGKEKKKLSVSDFQARKGYYNAAGERLSDAEVNRLIGPGKNLGVGLSGLKRRGYSYINNSAEEEFELAQREGRDFTEIDHGMGQLERGYRDLAGFVAKGPGEADITAGLDAQRGLAGMLEELRKSGGLPGQEDINQANTTAGGLFNARRTALSQSFQDQNTEAERLAARLGRSTNDPILQAKLRTGFMRQQDSLQAEQSDYANQLALSLPNQRLNYASSRADVLGGLASQAFQNRAAILSLGSQLGGAERAWRAQSGTQVSNGSQSSGGGLAGALTGGIAGLGAGLDIASKFGAGSTSPFSAEKFMSQGPSVADVFGARGLSRSPSSVLSTSLNSPSWKSTISTRPMFGPPAPFLETR